MKIYFNSDFTITKREYEEYFLGSEYHNKIEVYFPMTTYGNYTYIYPVFNVKRPDDRKFGEFALTEYNVENDYIVWRADLPAKALEIEGTLEITILFKYSTDNKYAKVSTGKVLLNVKEAVIGEENDVIYVGSGDNLQGEIDAIRNEFGVRFDNVETHFISDLAELDNYKTPGIYRFNLDNLNVFHLFIYGYENEFTQIRSSAGGYYSRNYDNRVWTEWNRRNYAFTDNLKTVNGESIVGSGNIEVKGADVDLSDYLKNGDNKPDTNISAVYNSLNIYGKDYARGLSVQENNTGIFDNGSSIYLRDNDVIINNKSFNELYRKVQNIYGLYIDFNIDDAISYFKLVPSGVATYSNINKVGGMSYKSKNLLVLDDVAETTLNGITYSIKNDVITLNGTTTKDMSLYCFVKELLKTPINSLTYNNTFFITGKKSEKVIDLYIALYDGTSYSTQPSGAITADVNENTTYSKSFTYSGNNYLRGLSMYVRNGTIFTNYQIKPMLVKGSTAPTEFIQGFDGIRHSKVANISHASGNLLQLSNVAETTKNGGTLSLINSTIKLNGTFTAYSDFVITLPKPITFKAGVSYSFNMFPSKNEGSWGLRFRTADNTNIISFTNQNNTSYDFKVNVDTVCTKILVYANIATYSNLTISPMVINATTLPTTFKPYAVYKNIDLSNYQTLDDYGVGIDENCYNYIDFDRNVFVKKVGSYTFTGDERMGQTTSSSGLYRYWCSDLEELIVKPSSNAEVGNILMAELDILTANQIGADNEGIAVNVNGTLTIFKKDIQTLDAMKSYLKGKTLYYELATPTETTISEIDTLIEVEQGDVITFENEYQNAVPSEIEYQVKAGN